MPRPAVNTNPRSSTRFFRLRWLPNAITILRIVLVAPFAWFVLKTDYLAALLVFSVAGLSDGVDGFLARRYDWGSRFGAIADPLADKLLMTVSFGVLSLAGAVDWWLTGLVYLRDLILISGALCYHFLVHQYDMQPSLPGKLSTLMQIVFLGFVLLAMTLETSGHVQVSGAAVASAHWLTAAITLFSGMHYVLVWGGRFIFERSRSKGGQ